MQIFDFFPPPPPHGVDSPPGTLERLDRFRALEPQVEISSPRVNGLGVWQATWRVPGGGTEITTSHKTCAGLLGALRPHFPEWEPQPTLVKDPEES